MPKSLWWSQWEAPPRPRSFRGARQRPPQRLGFLTCLSGNSFLVHKVGPEGVVKLSKEAK